MARPLAVAISFCVGVLAIAAGLVYSCMLEVEPGVASSRSPLLLVTAHPDDEAMFFAPTLLALARSGCCQVHILCLSNGEPGFNGSGVRVREAVNQLDYHVAVM